MQKKKKQKKNNKKTTKKKTPKKTKKKNQTNDFLYYVESTVVLSFLPDVSVVSLFQGEQKCSEQADRGLHFSHMSSETIFT